MVVKVKLSSTKHSLWFRLLRVALVVVVACAVVAAGFVAYFYEHYRGDVEARLAQGPLFPPVAQIYAAPEEVRTGQQLSAATIAASLRRSGYDSNPQLGSYELRGDSILIKPGPQSYLAMDGATITTSEGQVRSITAENGAPLAGYKLEPQLITALSEDKNRTKRRLVTYDQIPPRMVQAVMAIEDRRFFEHGGLNYGRTLKCAVQDLLAHHMNCGGSTLTQQLARGFFLTPDKTISRKIAEIMITFQLEARFSKKQIFEMYANEINLGQRGTFGINGVGEAAQAYFGKDLRQLDLAQCALLAGLIQSPNRRNPYRHPERAMERRNVVLQSMVETGAISQDQADSAKAEPLNLAPLNIDASEAPYFVDLVHEQIVSRLGESDTSHSALRIYTSLDPELQRTAAEAVEMSMPKVDEMVRKRYKKGETDITYPQVALVALNPHTGQVLALVGGRNYGSSQLDHALAERPTGSIFKPFVYAAAYDTSLNGTDLGSGPFTALTQISDDSTTFMFAGKPYTPGNFVKGEYPGMVTATQAIEHSLNIATVALAQMVGFDNVATLARSAGIVNARGTPAVALGTYNATPLEMAGAYTTFANSGVHLRPWVLASVRNAQGDIVADFTPEAKQVLDPRVAFLTQSLLENVMAHGTGSMVRALGFNAPAAGKTGTSHDVWFAGYTSNLLCVVWIGNDDYTNMNMEGAKVAAPIWAAFMKRAIRLPQYSDVKSFVPPEGIETLRIDRATDLIVDDSCPSDSFSAAFLIGTAPQSTCSHMGQEDTQSLGNRIFSMGVAGPSGISPVAPKPVTPVPVGRSPAVSGATPSALPSAPSSAQPADTSSTDAKKHRNFFQKLFGTGKDKPPSPDQPQPAAPQ